MIISNSSYDHIFSLINKINEKTHKELQHKFKRIINIDDLKYGELFAIKNNHSIARISQLLLTSHQIKDTERTLQLLKTLAQNKSHENIALNIDFSDARSYFEFKTIIRGIFSSSNIKVTLFLNKIIEILDIDDIKNTLNNYHSTLLGGHASYERMLNSIRKYYKWNNMGSDVKNYVKNCTICQKNKITRHNRQPLIITSIPIACFETIFIDHIGKINPVIDNYAYILTIICDLSKFAIAVAVPDNGADTTARKLVENVFLKYGFPSKIVSDNHKTFTGETLRKISKILKINQVFTSPYTPSSNVVERFHRTLNTYLRSFVSQNPNRWPDILNYATWAYNNTLHTGTNYTPFELVYGRNMTLPNSISHSQPSYTYDNYCDELKNNLGIAWKSARENLIKRKQQNKILHDESHKTKNLDLAINDFVFLLKFPKNHKFDEIYEGPYQVTELTGPNSVKIKKQGKIIRCHKNKLKKFTGHSQNDTST